jgi:hypothetical protein
LCDFLEYHPSGLGYGGGYNFGGGLGGHSSGGDNSLEGGVGGGGGGFGGSGGGFGDFGHHHYHMGQGKQPNPKSMALKGLLVPLAGVALLGKITTSYLVTTGNDMEADIVPRLNF